MPITVGRWMIEGLGSDSTKALHCKGFYIVISLQGFVRFS